MQIAPTTKKVPAAVQLYFIYGPEYVKFENTKIAHYVEIVARWK